MRKRKIRILLLLAGGAALILFAAGWWNYLHPKVGYVYFEPGYLPPGVSIKAKRILIQSGAGIMTAEQNFRTEDWVYAIEEYKAAGFSIGDAPQNYDPTSIKPTCSFETSPGGQRYRLCHWIDYGRIGVYEVKFIKGGTLVSSMIPTTLQQTISVGDISRFVDSFQAKPTWTLPVNRSAGP